MADMTLSDYAAMREIECQHGKGWGLSTAVWVLVAAVIIFAIVYNWTKTSNEKAQFATSLARLDGRIDCLEPDVRWAGQQLYAANGAISAVVQGVGDMKTNFGNQLFQLNREVFYDEGCGCGGNGYRRNGCGCGNREFAQTQTYTLASQGVTVTEKCVN